MHRFCFVFVLSAHLMMTKHDDIESYSGYVDKFYITEVIGLCLRLLHFCLDNINQYMRF